MQRQFRVPRTDAPTRYLFVGNCGPRVGLEKEDVQRLFSTFGPVEVDITEEEKSYLFVTFPDVAAAQAAMLHFTEVDTTHRFIIKYTEVKEPTRSSQEPIVLYYEAEDCGVPGLQLLKDFITEEEERVLLSYVLDDGSNIEWETHTGRRVAHFGVRFDYATRNISRSTEVRPFPECVLPVVQRIEQCEHVPTLDQLTVNAYPPGTGLASHIDTHSAFSGAISALSIGSAAVMLFRKETERRRLLLPRRSLLIMALDARYVWQHAIPPNRMQRETTDRISFTFRQSRGFPCTCCYPRYCDSQQGGLPPTRLLLERTQNETQEASGPSEEHCTALEEEYVHRVYDTIARHFSATRQQEHSYPAGSDEFCCRFAVWPKVRAFLESLAAGAMLADIGCGNGKYFDVRKDLVVLGFDRSEGLLRAAIDRHTPEGLPSAQKSFADVAVADGLTLPLRDQTVDAVLCIAVLHHISNIDRRLKVLHEIARVLRPDGRALITVWAQEQEDTEKSLARWSPIQQQDSPEYVQEVMGGLHGADYFVPWHLPLHRAEGQIAAQRVQSEGGNGGTINEEKRSVMFHRYYHLYVKGEIERLCGRVTNARVVDAFYDKSNWCVVLQKSM